MKKFAILATMMLIVFLTACSEDQVSPNERFDEYVQQWNSLEFNGMYAMHTTETRESYGEEESTSRMEKIYQDLNVNELSVNYEALSDEEVDAAFSEGMATIPYQVEMETIAGPVVFENEATLVQEGEESEEEANWYVEWHPGFIFPELESGGEISIQTVDPERGEILDRNDMPLALNDVVYNIGIVPERLGENAEQAKEEAADLLQMSVEEINQALDASWVQPTTFVPLKEIPREDEQLLQEVVEMDGFTYQESTGRVYPAGEAAAHLTGYLRQVNAEDLEEDEEGEYSASDMIGSRGLESLYEDKLRGERGVKILALNGEEETVIAEQEVQHGEDVKLTIDINMQEKVFNSYDGDAGTSALLDPKTGETLALVSSPSFDPNELMYHSTNSLWEELQEDERQPLLNRFSATYAPGSVIKPVTAAIGMQHGTLDPQEGIEIDGLTWSNGEGWGEYEVTRVSESDGPVDLKDALVRSDNIYFAMEALEMGADALVAGLENFGFSEDIPYEYPIEASSISNDGTIEDDVLLANTSYGQGEMEMSALHLAATYTPLMNEGNMMKPVLLADEDTGQVWEESLMTAEQTDIINDALRAVVTEGTAAPAQESDFPLSGKTGTAELKLTEDDQDSGVNSWFVAYPSDDQDLVLAMMVEQTQDKESGYAVKKATELLNEIK
ncbi:penicillin-binding transpeptidase domain-containing protein [Virgibacillus xinjiangensis]|uniref:serine-type D-Ala-D-Ala carboxypeptidase n=1 Tax=Virgibacillus xinjiangensis TaxID=393090 RepID=A0ABV7CZ48_9BACI